MAVAESGSRFGTAQDLRPPRSCAVVGCGSVPEALSDLQVVAAGDATIAMWVLRGEGYGAMMRG